MTPRSHRCLARSATIVQNPGAIGDLNLGSVRDAGVTEEAIGEVVGHIALTFPTHHFNVLAEVVIDRPVVSLRGH